MAYLKGYMVPPGQGGNITMTSLQYQALPEADKLDPDKYYFLSDLEGDYDNIRDIVAPTEYSTAVGNRAVGDEFILGDYLYKAISAIAQGDDIVTSGAGQNAALAGTIVSQIKALFDGVDNVRANIDNPNLLDNPWFTINQRGESSYSAAGYTVDRWSNSSTQTITVNSDGSITNSANAGTQTRYFQQFIEDSIRDLLAGKKVTISAIVNGVLYQATATMPATISASTTLVSVVIDTNFTLALRTSSNNTLCFYFARGSANTTNYTIRAVKLEIGSISTLAEDVAPNYEEELLKCQRYFVRYRYLDTSSQMSGSATLLAFGYVTEVNTTNDTLKSRHLLYLPVVMRTDNPAVTMTGNFSIGLIAKNQERQVNSITKLWRTENNAVSLEVTSVYNSTGVSVGDMLILRTKSRENYLDFSADL